MNWFHPAGLMFMGVLMIPNMIYAVWCKEGFINLWHNKAIQVLEQIGRFGCFGFMGFSIPGTTLLFASEGAFRLYLLINSILLALYCLVWLFCFRRNSVFRALALSILPAAMFLFSGIISRSLLLTLAAAVFAPCHILLSYKNAAMAKGA